MSSYQFNRQKVLKKATTKKKSKEKAAEYFLQNKEAIQEKSREQYKNLSKEEKDKIKEYKKTTISATDSVQKRSFTK